LLEKNNHYRPNAIELLKTAFVGKYMRKVVADLYDIDPLLGIKVSNQLSELIPTISSNIGFLINS